MFHVEPGLQRDIYYSYICAMQIGARLKAWREYRSLSQGELADRAGYKQAQISAIETGKQGRIHPSTSRKLAEALGISVEEFAGMPPNAQPKAQEPTDEWLSLNKDKIFEGGELLAAKGELTELELLRWIQDMRLRGIIK